MKRLRIRTREVDSGALPLVTLTSRTLTRVGANNGVYFDPDGLLYQVENNSRSTLLSGEYRTAGSSVGFGVDYEIVLTVNSGTAASGAALPAGTWAVAGTPTRLNNPVAAGLSTAGSFTVIIRPFGGGATIASATYTLP